MNWLFLFVSYAYAPQTEEYSLILRMPGFIPVLIKTEIFKETKKKKKWGEIINKKFDNSENLKVDRRSFAWKS